MHAKTRSILLLGAVLSAGLWADAEGAWEPKSWSAPLSPDEARALSDGNDATVCSFPLARDFGIESAVPAKLNRVTVRYVSLHGSVLQPDPQSAGLEVWRGGRWQKLPAQVCIDYRQWNKLAQYQMYGTVEWTFRFPAVETTRVRIVVRKCQEPQLRWCLSLVYRGVLPAEINGDPVEEEEQLALGNVKEAGRPEHLLLPSFPPGSRPECLTDPLYGPVTRASGGGLEVAWATTGTSTCRSCWSCSSSPRAGRRPSGFAPLPAIEGASPWASPGFATASTGIMAWATSSICSGRAGASSSC